MTTYVQCEECGTVKYEIPETPEVHVSNEFFDMLNAFDALRDAGHKEKWRSERWKYPSKIKTSSFFWTLFERSIYREMQGKTVPNFRITLPRRQKYIMRTKRKIEFKRLCEWDDDTFLGLFT